MNYRSLCKESQYKVIHGSKSALSGIIDGRFGGKLCVGYALVVDTSDNIIAVYALYNDDLIIENWTVKKISNKSIIER
jgi:hypothetical protein